jgi:predicted DCC family thiol-disulfide oxidoreductase YuxK
VRHPPPDRPLLIFDGDCNFCRRWIARWEKGTGPCVDYVEFQKIGGRFPEIPRTAYEQAVQLIELDGRVLSGADAVLRLLDFAPQKR